MPNPFFWKNSSGNRLIHSWKIKGVKSFPKAICPKITVIMRLELKLAYCDSAVQLFNHYTPRTPHQHSEMTSHK